MKTAKIVLLVVVLALVAIQLVPDKMPENVGINPGDIVNTGKVPENISAILKTSCYDCHSNVTRFPWYTGLAPASWLLARDIRLGREQLNFSTWEAYSKRQKIGKLESLRDEVASGDMPLKIYTIMHRKARLTPDQVSALSEWTEEMTMHIME
jgi:hypothetical protein